MHLPAHSYGGGWIQRGCKTSLIARLQFFGKPGMPGALARLHCTITKTSTTHNSSTAKRFAVRRALRRMVLWRRVSVGSLVSLRGNGELRPLRPEHLSMRLFRERAACVYRFASAIPRQARLDVRRLDAPDGPFKNCERR